MVTRKIYIRCQNPIPNDPRKEDSEKQKLSLNAIPAFLLVILAEAGIQWGWGRQKDTE
jgi:hypothetical protein